MLLKNNFENQLLIYKFAYQFIDQFLTFNQLNHCLIIMTNIETELSNHLNQFDTLPYLFIGSGFSQRYINLPTWRNLLIELCQKLEMKHDYNYYNGLHSEDLPSVAQAMAEEFYPIWWDKPQFAAIREQKLNECVNKQLINNKNNNNKYINEIEILKEINIQGIITTNWDTFLEMIFPNLAKYIGQEELIFKQSYSVGELFKIHGCVTNPKSLVFVKDDYEEFTKKQSYLIAKLLTIFLEHPVIFIGYSLNDNHINMIIDTIVSILTQEQLDKLKDRLVFCRRTKNAESPIFRDFSLKLSGSSILPTKELVLDRDNYTPLYQALKQNKPKMPVKVLRQLQSMVYEFVKSKEPKTIILVNDNDYDSLQKEGVEFVVGVGLSEQLSIIGYKSIEANDIYHDVIFNDKNYDNVQIIKNSFPNIAKGKIHLPYFKYLRDAMKIDEQGIIYGVETLIDQKTIKRINDVNLETIKKGHPLSIVVKEALNKNNFEEILNSFDKRIDYKISAILHMNESKFRLQELHDFIVKHYSEIMDTKPNTQAKKLIRLYDFLKYKMQKD